MTEEIATADAEAGKISVDKSNISVTDFAQRRIGELTPGTEQPKEEELPKKEEATEKWTVHMLRIAVWLDGKKSETSRDDRAARLW